MQNGARKLWVLAYIVGVGIFSGGVTIACTFFSVGDFSERPSPFFGAYAESECMSRYGVPNCGYYLCTGGGCGGYSQIQGCTTASSSEMYAYMLAGCRDVLCGQ